MDFLKCFFKLQENNTTAGREIYTGIIMFLAVAYILAVNPAILSSAGMERGGLFYVTALAAALGGFAPVCRQICLLVSSLFKDRILWKILRYSKLPPKSMNA